MCLLNWLSGVLLPMCFWGSHKNRKNSQLITDTQCWGQWISEIQSEKQSGTVWAVRSGHCSIKVNSTVTWRSYLSSEQPTDLPMPLCQYWSKLSFALSSHCTSWRSIHLHPPPPFSLPHSLPPSVRQTTWSWLVTLGPSVAGTNRATRPGYHPANGPQDGHDLLEASSVANTQYYLPQVM